MFKTKRNRDETTAHALEISYEAFVSRQALLRQQADAQRPGRRRFFRFLLPCVAEAVTRMDFSKSRSMLIDKLIAGSEK